MQQPISQMLPHSRSTVSEKIEHAFLEPHTLCFPCNMQEATWYRCAEMCFSNQHVLHSWQRKKSENITIFILHWARKLYCTFRETRSSLYYWCCSFGFVLLAEMTLERKPWHSHSPFSLTLHYILSNTNTLMKLPQQKQSHKGKC